MSGNATFTIVASIETISRLRQQVASTAPSRTGWGEGRLPAGEIIVFIQPLYKHNRTASMDDAPFPFGVCVPMGVPNPGARDGAGQALQAGDESPRGADLR